MPGVLKRKASHADLDDTESSSNAKAIRMAGDGPEMESGQGISHDEKHTNGVLALVNGKYANGAEPIPAPAFSDQDLALTVSGPTQIVPPEIDHITYGYHSLSTLINRLVQDTFGGLGDVLTEMSDLETSQDHGANGQVSNGISMEYANQINIKKKTGLWTFAQDRRAKFIKLLVLSRWSQQAEDIRKLIDLNMWIDGQKRLYKGASDWMGELKRILAPIKIPSPDLGTALEALSVGRISSLPDFGYLPPKRLSAQQLLKALHTINTLLSIRLNLYETIPPPFRDFSIKSGRATFRIPDEFALDLSIADEEPTSQLFFIDFRFLFSPCSNNVPPGRLRDEIEGKCNDVLKRDGLPGCYDYLHDLVLTHKLSVLRSQAHELARGRFSDNLIVETVHRAFVVQYWPNRPGGKNWVEFGVRRGKQKNTTGHDDYSPCIAIRWHAHGKEIPDPAIALDVGDLSMDRILKKIISMHTNRIFTETKKRLREGPIYAKSMLALKHTASKREPVDCALSMQITTSDTVSLQQEPISGAFALQPASPLHTRIERDLNALRDPATEAAVRLVNLRYITTQEKVESNGRSTGWESLKALDTRHETIKRLFAVEISRLLFFQVRRWSSNWLLAWTTSMSGDSWWVIERPADNNSSAFTPSLPLKTAFKIPLIGPRSSILDPSAAILSKLETTASAIISQYIDCRYLRHLQISHRQQPTSRSADQTPIPTLYIRFPPSLMPSKPHASSTSSPSRMWCHEIIKSAIPGLSHKRDATVHLVSGQLITPIPDINALTTKVDSTVTFHPTSGQFAFRIVIPIGKPSIPIIIDRLRRIERLVRFLQFIQKNQLEAGTVSLSRLVFTYATEPTLYVADIGFPTDSSMRIAFDKSNPHLRIQDFLTNMLNANSPLEDILRLLRTTLPILRGFSLIESSSATTSKDDLSIFARSATWYRLRYVKTSSLFEIKLRSRRDEVLWYIQDVSTSKMIKSQRARAEFRNLCTDHGESWRGMRNGIVAEVDGIEELVKKIDETVRMVNNEDPPTEDDATVQPGDRPIVVLD